MKQLIFLLKALIATFSISAQVPNTLSPAEKVFGLSRIWQEVNYNFIYLDKIDRVKWDSTYKALITKVQDTKDDYQYYRELQKFCAFLKDGHTSVYMPKGIMILRENFGDYWLAVRNFDGKAIITETALSKKDEIPIGSEIIKVNGEPTERYINENVAPYISSSTEHELKDRSFLSLLQGLEGETYQVEIKKPNGKIISLSLTHKRSDGKLVIFPTPKEKKLADFKMYDNQVFYAALNSFNSPEITELFAEKAPEFYKAKGLIIDLRNNRGGNSVIGTGIFKYLTNDKLLNSPKVTSRQHIPAYKAWGRSLSPRDTVNDDWAKICFLSSQDKYYYKLDYNPESNKLEGKRVVVPTVLLIGHNTFSAAEDFLMLTDNQKHMIKIGEKTGGSTGNILFVNLPGGGTGIICTLKDTYPDGREFVGYGIKPDIEVKTTLNDFLNQKDPVLDRALEYLKTKIK